MGEKSRKKKRLRKGICADPGETQIATLDAMEVTALKPGDTFYLDLRYQGWFKDSVGANAIGGHVDCSPHSAEPPLCLRSRGNFE